MKEYDLREEGNNCINNPAVKIANLLARGEDTIRIVVRSADVPAMILREVAKASGYVVVEMEEKGGELTVLLKISEDQKGGHS